MTNGLYEDLSKDNTKIDIKNRSDLRKIYFDFLQDFKHHLAEFVKESLVELCISEMPISTTAVKLFEDDCHGMRILLKNQGNVDCYISTIGMGGFKINPGEKTPTIWLNKPITAVTLSGNTTIGFIRT